MKLKRNVVSIVLGLALVLGLMLAMTVTAHAEDYDLWVGGTQVTSENADNITGAATPTACYDAESKTLTLNGYKFANQTGSTPAIKFAGELTIESAEGSDNKLLTGYTESIIATDNGNLTITGSGSLSIENWYSSKIGVKVGNLTVDSGAKFYVQCTSSEATAGIKLDENGVLDIAEDASLAVYVLNGNNGKAIIGKVKYAITGTGYDKNIRRYDILVSDMPSEGADLSGYVGVKFPKSYNLIVNGVQVDEANKGDVLADDPVNKGKVSFTPAATGDTPTPATLTLSGATITKGYQNLFGEYGVYYAEEDALNIVLAKGSVNSIDKAGDSDFGTGFSSDAERAVITFSGTGKLSVTGKSQALYSAGNLVVEDCTLNATATGSKSTAISASGNRLYAGLVIKSGTINASGSTALYGDYVEIGGGTVVAAGDKDSGAGIVTYNNSRDVDITGGKLEVTGGAAAIYGVVKNTIEGTGWSDVAGTQDETAIEISSEGQDLNFKKVKFPSASPAEIVTEQIRALPAFNKISTADEEQILAARAAYEALTDDEKAQVKSSVLRKLQKAETALAGAKNAAAQKAKREKAEQLAKERYVIIRDKTADDAEQAKENIKENVDPIKGKTEKVQDAIDDIDESAKQVADNIKDAASKISGTTKRLVRQAIVIIRRWIKH